MKFKGKITEALLLMKGEGNKKIWRLTIEVEASEVKHAQLIRGMHHGVTLKIKERQVGE